MAFIDLRQGFPQRCRRLHMGESPGRLLGEACEVLDCPVGLVSLRVMIREPVVGRFEPIDVHLLQGFGGLGVKRLATRVRDALVDHLLRQRVLEDVERFLDARPGVKELLSRELAQMRLGVARRIQDRPEQVTGNLPPHDGRRLKNPLRLVGKPMNPRE